MALAVVHGSLSTSPTWRQFQTACGCAAITISVGCLLYAVETLLLHCEHRFVENPADTMTRAIGLAHFSIGWLFLFTSPRLRNRVALTRLTLWTAFGIGFCWVFANFGADKNPFLSLAFFSFFFIHEVCDEASLFRNSGELTNDVGAGRFLRSLCWSMSLLLIATLAGFQILRGHVFGRSAMLVELPTTWLVAGWCGLGAGAALAVGHTVRCARTCYGSVAEAILVYRPLLAVYAGISAILLVGSMFGSIGTSLIILVHGSTWLVCTYRRLGEAGGAAARNPLAGVWWWIRSTPTGFLTLHVGLTALALCLFALRTHVWQRTGLVCDLMSRTWFPYWSIMHIAMSFWRSK